MLYAHAEEEEGRWILVVSWNGIKLKSTDSFSTELEALDLYEDMRNYIRYSITV